jgi:hypothetical protein
LISLLLWKDALTPEIVLANVKAYRL